MLARPHLLAWPLFALWLAMLFRARDRSTAPPIWAAALILLWANLHGSWALGIVVAGFVGLDTVVANRWDPRLVGRWAMFGLASIAAALITPHGINGFIHPLAISSMEILPLIVEWRPSDFERTPFFFAAFAITALIVLWHGLRKRSWVIELLLLLLVGLALYQMRHQAMLAIASALILPRLISSRERPELPLRLRSRRLLVAILFASIGAMAIFRAVRPLEPEENGANPKSAIAALPPSLYDRPGLNGYGFGGPLILAGVNVYIDGRADMYGDAFVKEYRRILDGDQAAFAAADQRHDFQWTMLPPRYEKLVAHLDGDPNWRRIHTDPVAVVHRRVAD